MKYIRITKIILLSVTALLVGWDIFAMAQGHESTITSVVFVLSHKYPFIVFLSGFVCGHLFWRSNSDDQMNKIITKLFKRNNL